MHDITMLISAANLVALIVMMFVLIHLARKHKRKRHI